MGCFGIDMERLRSRETNRSMGGTGRRQLDHSTFVVLSLDRSCDLNGECSQTMAFKSIIENGVIRAGHYRALKNDESEVSFGTEELRKAVEAHVNDECDAEYKAFLLECIDRYSDGDLAIYIVCFTSTVDSSHHWREYAPPCQQGIAIGFDSSQVYKGFLTDIGKGLGHKVPDSILGHPEYRPIHCRYFEQFDMAALIAKRFFGNQSYPALFRSPHVSQGIGQQIFLSTLSISIYQIIVSIKQCEFSTDMEVRLFHPITKKDIQ